MAEAPTVDVPLNRTELDSMVNAIQWKLEQLFKLQAVGNYRDLIDHYKALRDKLGSFQTRLGPDR